jgi:Flp pilus assembly protein TadG
MRRFLRSGRGQSLVEFALALPVLLILVLGIADLGRFTYYGIAVTQAAHDVAAYAALNPGADQSQLDAVACAKMKLAVRCTDVTAVRLAEDPPQGNLSLTTRVRVEYGFTLISAFIVERMNVSNIKLSSEATYHGYTQ